MNYILRGSRGMSSSLASFDIWDTCLTRKVSDPKHVFFEVAMALEKSERYDDPKVAEIARMRIRAEQVAREGAPNNECNFKEIQSALSVLIGKDAATEFSEIELSLEKKMVRPIEKTRQLVKEARSNGAKIAFISDMYLPSDFLHSLLTEHGFAQEADRVFVSCEFRCGKYTGELFRKVQDELKCRATRWSHLGDRYLADVRMPREQGIQGELFSDIELTDAEQRAEEVALAFPRIGSAMVGGMRALRLALPFERHRASLLANVVAPWICALAARMVQRATEIGLKRLYFLSRDGEILHRIASKIAPSSLECRYLYSSRQAWCFPAMLANDAPSRRWLETFAVSPRSILTNLQFSSEEIVAIIDELDLSDTESRERAEPEQRSFVWEYLQNSGRMERVLERAAKSRAACLAYLEQEGLLRDDDWAVCDVGWSLNGQAALNRILKSKDPSRSARGLYFMVNDKRPDLDSSGPFDAWVTEEAFNKKGDTAPGLLMQLSGLIEEFFLCNADPSTRGYDFESEHGKAVPLFKNDVPSATKEGHASDLRTAVDFLSNEWSEELLDPKFVELLSQFSLSEVIRFFRKPTKEEASVVSEFRHSSEAGNANDDGELLARAWTMKDSARILLRRLRLTGKRESQPPIWTAGCDALTSPLSSWFRVLAMRPLPFRSGN